MVLQLKSQMLDLKIFSSHGALPQAVSRAASCLKNNSRLGLVRHDLQHITAYNDSRLNAPVAIGCDDAPSDLKGLPWYWQTSRSGTKESRVRGRVLAFGSCQACACLLHVHGNLVGNVAVLLNFTE